MSSNVCVVIPAYNASQTIGDVTRGALKHVSRVFVADDGSTDATGVNASAAGAEVITIDINKGKGNALKLLFQRAMKDGYDAVISMDADGQHNPDEIPSFIQYHKEYPNDVIIGTRMHEKKKIPRSRYNSMHIARFYICFAANQYIEDTQCGFRLYPLPLIKKIRLTSERYVTETELLLKAGDIGTIIRHVKINAIYDDGGSHFRPIIDMAAITAYVIFYLQIKWLIEGITSNRPFTYSSHNDIRDIIGRRKIINFLFQSITVVTALPSSLLFLVEFTFLSPLINNFIIVRRLNCKFFKITLATHMLPVVLLLMILEQLLKGTGFKCHFVDSLIQWFFPYLWTNSKNRCFLK